MIVVAIKDVVVGEFGDLGTFKTLEVAIRAFDVSTQKSPYAKDLQLFKIGDFNIDSGELVPDFKFIKNGGDEHVKVQL